jgi:hypothetical protein
MTKLTDLNRAREALPKPIESKGDYFQAGWFYEMDDIGDIHLEVDAEFLAKILSDCASENGFDYSTHGINVLSECIATNITKWARLVRK